MAIDADITYADLDKAILVLNTADTDEFQPRFQKAGQQTIDYLVKDEKAGAGKVSGDLRSAIGGEIQQIAGAEMTMLLSNGVEHNGYDYAARLDKDGSLSWRSGKFAGRRTFGWWTSSLKRNAPKTVKRYFQKAIEDVATALARKIGVQ